LQGVGLDDLKCPFQIKPFYNSMILRECKEVTETAVKSTEEL